jgi:hypothetical protein
VIRRNQSHSQHIEEGTMTILGNYTSAAERHPAATALILGTIGFVSGFLLSLIVAAYSLYACVEIL